MGCPLASCREHQSVGYARSACGRSSFGPGFDSPRLHLLKVSRDLTAPHKGAVSRFSLSHRGLARVSPRRCARGAVRRSSVSCSPKVRRLNQHWSDDEIFEIAESMAELRLLDEELG